MGEKATLATQRELIALRDADQSGSRLIGASVREGAQIGGLAGVDVLTMPTAAAAQYRQNPLPRVSSRVAEDPLVVLAGGAKLGDFAGHTLWDVSALFRESVARLLKGNLERLTPNDLQAHFEADGLGEFLPRWSLEDAAVVEAEGKIPKFPRWKARLASGQVGLDALMNLCALCSFTADQRALDNRIRSLLSKA